MSKETTQEIKLCFKKQYPKRYMNNRIYYKKLISESSYETKITLQSIREGINFMLDLEFQLEVILDVYKSQQIKKDGDEAQNDTSSGTPKQSQGKTKKVEHMPVKADNQSADSLVEIEVKE